MAEQIQKLTNVKKTSDLEDYKGQSTSFSEAGTGVI